MAIHSAADQLVTAGAGLQAQNWFYPRCPSKLLDTFFKFDVNHFLKLFIVMSLKHF